MNINFSSFYPHSLSFFMSIYLSHTHTLSLSLLLTLSHPVSPLCPICLCLFLFSTFPLLPILYRCNKQQRHLWSSCHIHCENCMEELPEFRYCSIQWSQRFSPYVGTNFTKKWKFHLWISTDFARSKIIHIAFTAIRCGRYN